MSGEVQPRKRKDKKKKKVDEGLRQDDFLDRPSVNDKGDDELLVRDDSEDRNHVDEHDSHHHGPTAGVCAKVVFFVLFAGLLAALGTIVFQLRGSEIADTPIKESRYAHILEHFVEEHAEHDDHDEVAAHGSGEEHGEEHDEEHPPDHEGIVEEPGPVEPPPAEEPKVDYVESILIEPSIPEEIEIPEPEEADEGDEEEEGTEEESEERQESEEIIEAPSEEEAAMPAADSAEPEETTQEEEDVPQSGEESTEESLEDHPTETIPELQEQEEPIARSYYEEQPDAQAESVETAGSGEEDDDKSAEGDDDDEGGILEGLFESMFSHIDPYGEVEKEESGDLDEVKSEPEFIAQDDGADEGVGDIGGTDEDDSPDFHENVETNVWEEAQVAGDSVEIEGETGEDDEVDEETQKEYKKIIDEVLREHQKESDARANYPASPITNDYDFEIRKDIDEADKLLAKKKKSLGKLKAEVFYLVDAVLVIIVLFL